MMKFFMELRRRNVLRVAGTFLVGSWFLVQIAFTLESVMNLPEWFDSLFMALLILGLPVAIILAWAFELTPEGFKRTETVDAEESIAAQTGKKLDVAILIGLILIGGLVLFSYIGPKPGEAKFTKIQGSSVAVLPFQNRSADTENAFFADGIHDELLTALAKVPGLDVISRTSVMGYRNTEKRVPEIAQELGAAAVLEGAVQKSGARVRITVQLIDGEDDTHIWANNYDRALTTENIFDIQGEITRVIANSLEDVLVGNIPGESSRNPTENINAFEAYIQGKLKTQPGEADKEELLKAIAHYDDAIRADPNYSKAWAGKAYAQLSLYWFHGRDDSFRKAAKISLDKARNLTPNALETRLSLAFYHYWGEEDYRAAEAAFDAALDVAPGNVDAIAGKAFIARRLGDFETALKGLEHAHRLDPLSFYLIPELALTYALLDKPAQANIMIDKARAMDSTSLQLSAFAAAVAQFAGNPDQAFVLFEPLKDYLPAERVKYALPTRDKENITMALAEWPKTMRETPDMEALYAIAQMRAALTIGSEADQMAAKEKLSEFHSESRSWDDGKTYNPVVVPGLLGDLEEVQKQADLYESLKPDDALSNLTDYGDIAEAFSRAGDLDSAMIYNEKMEALTGPHIIRVIEKDPAMDPLRNHPRYLAMKARAEN